MKKCPFCAEEIQDEAVKCRYCNEILIGNPLLLKKEQEAQQKIPWYCRGWTIFFICIFFPPFSSVLAVPLIWAHPNWSVSKKTTWSLVILGLSWLLWLLLKMALHGLEEYYRPIFKMMNVTF